MMKKLYITTIAISLSLLLGCSQQNVSIQTPKQNRTEIDFTNIDLNAVYDMVKSNNRFAFTLYSKLKDNRNNTLFSPYSINSAFMLLLLGADGGTKDSIKSAFFLNKEDTKIHQTFAKLSSKLDSSNLSIANALWPSKDNSLRESYLKDSLKYYGAKPITLDYQRETEKSREFINSWVEKITHDKIKDLLPSGSISPLTKMVITNAIYFKGKWSNPFDKKDTKEGDFKLQNGKTIKANFMHKNSKLPYYEDGNIQAVKLRYKKGLAMILIKPKSGVLSLDSNYYEKIFNSLRRKKVDLKMPRFKISTPTMRLRKPLKSIGLEPIFGNGANFSKLSKNSDLRVDDVLHKAYIKVDEEGTVAAAATAITMLPKSMPIYQKPISMILDSKFTFMIVDDMNGEIIFLGDVVKPIQE